MTDDAFSVSFRVKGSREYLDAKQIAWTAKEGVNIRVTDGRSSRRRSPWL